MGKGIDSASKQGGTPRPRYNKAGDVTGYEVRFRIDGRQTAKLLRTMEQANGFQELVTRLGPRQALIVANAASVPRPVKGPMLADWCTTYIEQLTLPKASTIQRYGRYIANDIAPVELGQIRVSQLDDGPIKEWVKTMVAAGARKGTVANKLRFLSGALNFAVKRGMLESNPAHGVGLPDDIKRAAVFLTADEFTGLLDEVPQRYKGFVEFLVESGARWGEAVELRLSDVDRVNSTVHIQRASRHEQGGGGYSIGPTKTLRSNRIIGIRRDVLDKVLGEMADGQELLFVNQNLTAIHANTFHTGTWKPALKRLGWPEYRTPRIHDLRHTHASWLLARGVPMLDVSRRLGHSSIATTDAVYSHCAPDAGDAIMAALDSTRGK
jgi:integrase